ncbi:MAG TPA: cyclic nucleotide-binding domain-containing protein [Acidimicrobiales bacterium]
MKVPGVFDAANEIREVPAGSVIFEVGDEGEEMFGVIAGKVELRMPDGRVFELGSDESFGEMAIVDTSPRSGTAVATEDASSSSWARRRLSRCR